MIAFFIGIIKFDSFTNLFPMITSLSEFHFRYRIILFVQTKEVISMSCDSSTCSWKPWGCNFILDIAPAPLYTLCLFSIVNKGLLTSLFYEKAYLLLSQSPFPPPKLFLLPCLFGWMCHHASSNVLYLNLLNFGFLVLAAHCCVFYATRHQTYWRFGMNDKAFASILVWYNKQRQHRQKTQVSIDWHTYKYILTPPVMCTQQELILY